MLYLAACGWTDTPWAQGFYPPDLPPEWRLDFYANEFSAVVVPAPLPDPRAVAEWVGQVSGRFSFLLEAGARMDRLGAVVGALGARCGGVLLRDGADLAAVRAAVGEGVALFGGDGAGGAVRYLKELPGPRQLRAVIEELAAGGADAVLAGDGPQAIEVLRNGRVIAGLLGVAV